MAEIRDLLGTTRKYVQALLEHLDAIGVTVREGIIENCRNKPASSQRERCPKLKLELIPTVAIMKLARDTSFSDLCNSERPVEKKGVPDENKAAVIARGGGHR